MDVNLYWDGNEITNNVISYERDEDICESSGFIDIILHGNDTNSYDFYDIITLYEEGVKKGTYKIDVIEKVRPDGTRKLHATNSQKNLLETYIDADRPVTDNPTELSKYWISLTLDDSDVTYAYDTLEDGQIVPEDENFGHDLASNIVARLLQYSGWYLRYDADGVARIGKLDYDSDTYAASIDGTRILSVRTAKDDRMLRNRAVVWGKGDPSTKSWIFADISTNTPYNYDLNDKRAVVISNHYIANNRAAKHLANMALKEFAKITYVKVITITGALDVTLGQRLLVRSKDFSGIGLITGIAARMSASGLTTEITLDKRCPRLVGIATFNGYVYVGTVGNGVWRKRLSTNHTWSDFSTGLANLTIRKLAIQNGIFACVDDVGDLYTRYVGDSAWVKFNPGSFYDDILNVYYGQASAICKSCTVDKTTNDIIALYNITLIDGSIKSWIVKITDNSIVKTNVKYDFFGAMNNELYVSDIDNNGKNNYLTSYSSYAYIPGLLYQFVGDAARFESSVYSSENELNSGFLLRNSLSYESDWTDTLASNLKGSAFGGGAYWKWRLADAATLEITRRTGEEAPEYTYIPGNTLYIDQCTLPSVYGATPTYYNPYSIRIYPLTENSCAIITRVSTSYYYPDMTFIIRILEITGHFPEVFTVTDYFLPSSATSIEAVTTMEYRGTRLTLFIDKSNHDCFTFDYDTLSFSDTVNLNSNWYSNIEPPDMNLIKTTVLSNYEYSGNGYAVYSLGPNGEAVGILNILTLSYINLFIADYSTGYDYYSGNMFPNFENNGCTIYNMYKGTAYYVIKVNPDGTSEKINFTGINQQGSLAVFDNFYYNRTRCFYGSFDPSNGTRHIYRGDDFTLHCKYENDDNFREYNGTTFLYEAVDFSRRIDDVNNCFYKSDRVNYSDIYSDRQIVAYNKNRKEFTYNNLIIDGFPALLSSEKEVELFGYCFLTYNWDIFNYQNRVLIPMFNDIEIAITVSNLLKQTKEGFEELGSLVANEMWVDCSKDLPIFVRGGDADLNNGEFQISFDGNNLLYPNNLLYASSEYPQPITGGQYITDYRTSDLYTEASGYERVGLVCQNNPNNDGDSYLRKVKYNFTEGGLDYYLGGVVISGMDWDNAYAKFTNIVRKVETTNSEDFPFMFVTTADADGATNTKFYQKDPFDITEEETSFVDRTNNLPDCEVTIIRVDEGL